MKEYYAFYDIAANPNGSPSSNKLGLEIYNHKDKMNDLPKLAASFAKLSDTVPLTNIIFPVNSIWNGLRDTHAALQTTTFGQTFDGATFLKYVNVFSKNDIDDGGHVSLVSISVSTSATGSPVFTNHIAGADPKVIKSIDGKEPLDWVASIADSTLFNFHWSKGKLVHCHE